MVERFFITRGQMAVVLLFLLVPIPFVSMFIGGLGGDSAVVVVVSGCLAALCGLFAVWFVAWVARPLALTETALLLPRALRSYRRLPLADIAAVGMVYVRGSRFTQWEPQVWLRDGSRVALPGRRFQGQPPARRPGDKEPAWSAIADSPAGRMCLRIRQAGLAVQGPYGPLALDTVPYRDNGAAPDGKYRARAYWSTVEDLGVGYPAPVSPSGQAGPSVTRPEGLT